MKTPWKKYTDLKDRLEELENKVDDLETENENLAQRFEAEEKRKKKLAREKQAAEEELNRLEDKLRSIEAEKESQDEEEESVSSEDAGFREVYRVLSKLGSLESAKEDFVTVYSPGKIKGIDDLKGLRNSVTKQEFSVLNGQESFISFIDRDLDSVLIKTVPFFEPDYEVGSGFSVGKILDFMEEGKHWALVSAGETRLFYEEKGDVEEVDRVKSRVNRQHSSGGFSQGRFERKRDEQIESHLDEVGEMIGEYENVYLLGEKKLCKDLPGTYLGGFNPNRSRPEQFYRFRILSF